LTFVHEKHCFLLKVEFGAEKEMIIAHCRIRLPGNLSQLTDIAPNVTAYNLLIIERKWDSILDCIGGHVQSRATAVEEILGRKKPGGTAPQLYRKLELLLCSHFPVCLHSNKHCSMYSSDSRTCRAIVLHINLLTLEFGI
jgi:hypothetical protein